MSPDISIIILNYHTDALVRECVKSFLSHSTRRTFEIIVVDNDGDGSLGVTLKKRFGEISYIRLARNIGYAAGNNVGMHHARGRYVLICNPDITAHDSVLDSLHDFMEENSTVGIAAPRLMNPDGTTQQSYYRFYRLFTPLFRRSLIGRFPVARDHLRWFEMKDVVFDGPQDVDLLMGACLFVRSAALEVVGGFDERFFLYFEDTDWCRRFWNHGFRVCYVPDASVTHLHKRDSAQRMGLLSLFSPLTRIHIASGIKYFLKHWNSYARKETPLRTE